MPEVVVQYKWTVDELIAARHWHYRQRVRRFFRGALWGLAILFSALGIVLLFEEPVSGVGLIIVGSAMVMSQPVIVPWITRRQFKKRPDQDVEIEWRISADGIKSRSNVGNSDLSWRAFARIVQTPAGFLFYPNMQIFHWLPRHGFANDDDFDCLAQLAQQNGIEFRRVL